MSALPLSANGKINRKALPDPDFSAEQDYVAPATAVEQQLVSIWQAVLKLDSVGVTSNFFALGGHSLLATRVVSAIGAQMDKTLSVRAMFEFPTIKALAQHLEQLQQVSFANIERVSRNQGLPLSFAQQRLWFIDQLEQGSSQYNIPMTMALRGALNLSALQQSLDAIVDRHEVLRTVFEQNEQQILPSQAVNIRLIDLTEDTAAKSEAGVQEVIKQLSQQEASKPFDLTTDLMLRTTLLHLASDHHIVLFTMHHIASDGWSTGILIDEFSALYSAFSRDEENPLTPLVIQYADFAHWQRTYLQGDVLDLQLDYWCEQLDDIPQVHSLPLDQFAIGLSEFQWR